MIPCQLIRFPAVWYPTVSILDSVMLLLLLKGKGNLMVLKFTVFPQKEDHSKF